MHATEEATRRVACCAAPSASLFKIVNAPAVPALAATGRFLWIRRNRRAKWMPPGSERTRTLAVRTTHFFNSSLSTPDPVPARESSKHPHEHHRTQHHESPSKISHGGNFIFLAERSNQIAAFEFFSRSSRPHRCASV